MRTRFTYGVPVAIAVLFLLSLGTRNASARGGHGGLVGSTASQYTGQGYWPEMATANSPLGGMPNAMTEPVAPWLAEPSIPPRWRAADKAQPNPTPTADQSGSPAPSPAGVVQISGPRAHD